MGSEFQDVYQAWQRCARRKRGTPQAQRFEAHLLDELITLSEALESQQWQPSPPVSFTVSQPKAREIHAAAFRDRVVHHYLVPKLEAVYEPAFIHDVYSNRKGKGTHAAVKRVQYFMRALRASSGLSTGHPNGCKQGKTPLPRVYFLQLDIKNFFMSIDRTVLFVLIQRRLRKALNKGQISEAEATHLRGLTHQVLRQDAGTQAINIATAQELACVPHHKRLINAGAHKGLPIGNLSSQFFANVYLNELDQFIKHQLKCHYYLRYVDDFVLLHQRPEQLSIWREDIKRFLQEKLCLNLRDEGVLRPISNGVDFLGYIIRPDYILVRRRVLANLSKKLRVWQQAHISGSAERGWVLQAPLAALASIRAVLASYVGHFSHAQYYRLLEWLSCRRFPWLLLLFAFIPLPCAKGVRIVALTEPKQVSGYQSQKRWLSRQFFNATIKVQRGCEMDDVSGLGQNKIRYSRNYIGSQQAIRMRAAVHSVLVVENGYLRGGLKRRTVQVLRWAQPNGLYTAAVC